VERAHAWRTPEIEDPTNRYLIHPLSWALVGHLARLGVSPNAVSLAGLGSGIGAALALSHYDKPGWLPLAGALLLLWHILDGADGQLARLTGRSSELGKILDGLCDHGTFAALYVSLAWKASSWWGAWAWVLAVLAALSHFVQANAYELQRQLYDYWVYGKPSARPEDPDELRARLARARGPMVLFLLLYYAYVRLQRWVRSSYGAIEMYWNALQDPEARQEVRNLLRRYQAPMVRLWGLLSSNYRTAALLLACALGEPMGFFLWEIAGLNLLLGLLFALQAGRNRVLLRYMRGGEPTLGMAAFCLALRSFFIKRRT